MRIIEPDSMILFESRGYLTPLSKVLMRISVILCDFILILPIYLILKKFITGKEKVSFLFSRISMLFIITTRDINIFS